MPIACDGRHEVAGHEGVTGELRPVDVDGDEAHDAGEREADQHPGSTNSEFALSREANGVSMTANTSSTEMAPA